MKHQRAVLVALLILAALALNWGVLALFDQNSADRAEHSLVGIILLMAYVTLRARNRAIGVFFVALIPCYLGTVFPDLDIRLLGIGSHRNPLFHSSLSFFALALIVGQRAGLLAAMLVGYGVGLASHLWWDVLYYGDVRWLPGSTLDRLWLGVHGLLCLTTPGGAKNAFG